MPEHPQGVDLGREAIRRPTSLELPMGLKRTATATAGSPRRPPCFNTHGRDLYRLNSPSTCSPMRTPSLSIQ